MTSARKFKGRYCILLIYLNTLFIYKLLIYHPLTTKKLSWKLYAFCGDARVVSNPDVKPVALHTPRLDAYSARSLTTPSTSTNTPHTSPWALCDPNRSAVSHDCRVTLFRKPAPTSQLHRTASSISIQGADVDPDGYTEAAGNLKAQGKT
uniref:Uncharacterized protein n=1 Tax=Oryza glumipatula TaxID=40148 RepID=A0A0D9YCA5_9ORYZ